MSRKNGIRGVVQLPMALAALLSLILFFGIWGTLRQWRGLAETQLRLDRCTGKTALRLKADWKTLLKLNEAIRVGRAALLAGELAPPAAAAARAALVAAEIAQDGILVEWDLERAAWIIPGRCGNFSDIGSPLPVIRGVRPPPDPLGPRPLEWNPMPRSFTIRASHPPRYSAAETKELGNDWEARWISPK